MYQQIIVIFNISFGPVVVVWLLYVTVSGLTCSKRKVNYCLHRTKVKPNCLSPNRAKALTYDAVEEPTFPSQFSLFLLA